MCITESILLLQGLHFAVIVRGGIQLQVLLAGIDGLVEFIKGTFVQAFLDSQTVSGMGIIGKILLAGSSGISQFIIGDAVPAPLDGIEMGLVQITIFIEIAFAFAQGMGVLHHIIGDPFTLIHQSGHVGIVKQSPYQFVIFSLGLHLPDTVNEVGLDCALDIGYIET